MNPSNAAADLSLGNVLAANGRSKEADSAYYGFFASSIVHLYQKAYSQAIQDAERLATLAPQGADGNAMLAACFSSAGGTDEALEMIEKVVGLTAGNGLPWYEKHAGDGIGRFRPSC